MQPQQLLQYFVAAELAHLHIEHHDVRLARLHAREKLVRMAERADRVLAFVLQRVLQISAKIRVVVENRDIHQSGGRDRFNAHVLAFSTGSVTSRHAPPPGRFIAAIVPPC